MNGIAILAALLAVAGTAVMTIGTAVIIRRGDRDRDLAIHAASLMQAAGVPLILGAALAANDGDLIARAFVVAAFTLLTAPLTTHALARLALDKHRHGDSLAPREDVDGNGGRREDDGGSEGRQ